MTALRAYHGKPTTKAKYLRRVRQHRDADQLVQHYGYWQNGKGCAVGCTLHGSDLRNYETELGIPQMVAHLQDRIFEGLPKASARRWPDRFLSAIPVGADLSRVGPALMVLTLERRLAALAPETWGVRSAIEQTLIVLRTWRDTGVADASAAWSAAHAAWSAASAASAAWSAAHAAGSAASAASAAWSAARAAENAAWSAASAEWSAACCAAWWAEWSAEWEWLADTLLDLLRAAPVTARKAKP